MLGSRLSSHSGPSSFCFHLHIFLLLFVVVIHSMWSFWFEFRTMETPSYFFFFHFEKGDSGLGSLGSWRTMICWIKKRSLQKKKLNNNNRKIIMLIQIIISFLITAYERKISALYYIYTLFSGPCNIFSYRICLFSRNTPSTYYKDLGWINTKNYVYELFFVCIYVL